MSGRLSGAAWGMLGLLLLAVAGATHATAILALPWRGHRDAFSRVAMLAPVGVRVIVPAVGMQPDPLPFRDPAFVTALCRYDLREQPLRISLSRFESGFVTLGFHSRHGLAFYGLTVHAADAPRLDLVLGQDAASGTGGQHAISVTAPEPEGFVLIATPAGNGQDRSDALERLASITCSAP